MGIFKNFNEVSVHFSKCMGSKVLNHQGKSLGRISDIFVDYEDLYPLVIALQYKRKNKYFYILWEEIEEFSYQSVKINIDREEKAGKSFPKENSNKSIKSILANQFTEAIEYPPIGKVVLDRQIVDTSGKKVVRVNDIQLIKVGDYLRVTHAEVGLRSMIRRLGYEKLIDRTIKVFRPNSTYLTKTQLINWKYVHAIPSRNIHKNVKLNLSNDDIKGMHPADIADILEELDSFGRENIFSKLDLQTKAETLTEIDEEIVSSLINDENPEETARIIEEMDADDAVDLLHELDKSKAELIINNIKDSEQKEEVQELFEYEDNVAGGIMSNEFFEVSLTDTKETILNRIPDVFDELDSVNDIYIIDSNHKLLGMITLAELLANKENVYVKDVMRTEGIIAIEPDAHWKEIAEQMNKYNLFTIPIIKNEEILGVVSVDDILPYLLKEKS